MAKLSVENFLDLVKRSELVPADRLEQAVDELKQQHNGALPEDAQVLADHLIAADLLTAWHCKMLFDRKYRGFTLKNYRLLRPLGSGGMSTVYLAEHTLMKRRRAIKVLPKNRVDDSSYLARFRLEAQATASLDHPNIVRAYDIDNDGDNHFLVMEYVAGRDLQSMVKEGGPLDYDQAADYMAQAAEGLQHAHEAGLIHRDIKPANLLLDESNTVKILDLGLALFSSEDDKASLTIAHNENVLGTADYLSPEQALNSHKVTHHADIYSLGCTLYYLLTGHPPFPEGTLAQRIAKHQSQMPTSIKAERPDAPDALINICLRMMQKKPQQRYQSAREVAQALYDFLAERSARAAEMAGDSGVKVGAGDSSRRLARRPNTGSGSGKGSGSVRRARPVPRPDSGKFPTAGGSDKSTTVSDPALETMKGMGQGDTQRVEKKTGSSVRIKGLRVAKSLDATADSGQIDLGIKPDGLVTEESGGLLEQRLRRRKANSPLPPVAIYIGAGVLGLIVLIILIIALTSGGGSEQEPTPQPESNVPRDTSALPRDLSPQQHAIWS